MIYDLFDNIFFHGHKNDQLGSGIVINCLSDPDSFFRLADSRTLMIRKKCLQIR
jgi:hypothetical protein